MGDELRVTRRRGDAVEHITQSEWLEFPRNSPDFVAQDGMTATGPGGERVTIGGAIVLWTGDPSIEGIPFRWSEGVIIAPAGAGRAVEPALMVASAFDASVIGDDGEVDDAPLDTGPAWEFADGDESRPDPVAAAPPVFGRTAAERRRRARS